MKKSFKVDLYFICMVIVEVRHVPIAQAHLSEHCDTIALFNSVGLNDVEVSHFIIMGRLRRSDVICGIECLSHSTPCVGFVFNLLHEENAKMPLPGKFSGPQN